MLGDIKQTLSTLQDRQQEGGNQDIYKNFIENPHLEIEKFAQSQWKAVMNQLESAYTQQLIQEEFLQKIIDRFVSLTVKITEELKEYEIKDLFETQDQKLVQQANLEFLMTLFSCFKQNSQLDIIQNNPIIIQQDQVNQKQIELTKYGVSLVETLVKNLQQQNDDLDIQEEFLSILISKMKSIEIQNSAILLFQIPEVLKSNRDEFSKIIQQFLMQHEEIENYRIQITQTLISCQQRCPCCQSPCDSHHENWPAGVEGAGEVKHESRRGHYFRAFSGNYFQHEGKKMPYLECCEFIQNDHMVLLEQKQEPIRWEEFKKTDQIAKTWKLDFADRKKDEDESFKQTLIDLWGQTCELFSQTYDILPITYNEYIKVIQIYMRSKRFDINWITFLDESYSMRGEPWKNLVQSCQEILQLRQQDMNERKNQNKEYMTVLKFNTDCTPVSDIQKRLIDDELIQDFNESKITMKGGGTSFDSSFKMAYELFNKYSQSTDQLQNIILFVTDGVASCPTAQIEKIATEHQEQIFFVFLLGIGTSHAKCLHQMEEVFKAKGVRAEVKYANDFKESLQTIFQGISKQMTEVLRR